MSVLEKNSKSMETKWDLYRESIAKDFEVMQSSIDSNSKKALASEATIRSYKDKWDSLNILEDSIKQAAKKKFNAIKSAVKSELAEEILQEVRAKPIEVSREDLLEVKKEIASEVLALQEERPPASPPRGHPGRVVGV